MSTATIETVVDLREFIEDLKDEIIWNDQFTKSSSKLVEMTKRAKAEIAEGKSEPM